MDLTPFFLHAFIVIYFRIRVSLLQKTSHGNLSFERRSKYLLR